MDTLRINTKCLLNASLSTNTHKVYRIALNSFNKFRSFVKLPNVWPPPLEHIVFFISHHYEQGSAASTIATYLSALSFSEKINSYNIQPGNKFVITKLISGYKNLRNKQDSRLPITFPILSKLPHALSNVCKQVYEKILFKTAFILAFFGFLRISEFVFNQDSPDKTLRFQDISFVGQCLHVNIRYSKTDQKGYNSTLIITQLTNSEMCPVKALSKCMKVRPTSTDYLFCHSNGTPLTRYQFCAVLRHCIKFLGLNANSYKSHSFRIGAATQASLNAVDDESIKAMGRWKSQSYKKYIRISSNSLFK